MIYFTSDLHFGHDNIIRYCDRPWETVEDMNVGIVNRINSRVRPQDELYILGDVHCGKNSEEVALRYLREIKCSRIYLVRGNHDTDEFCEAAGPEAEGLFQWIKDYHEMKYKKLRIVLFHFAIRAWHHMYKGAIQLYGHSHGTLPGIGRQMDVGIDANDYQILSINEVYERMVKIPYTDPEGRRGNK